MGAGGGGGLSTSSSASTSTAQKANTSFGDVSFMLNPPQTTSTRNSQVPGISPTVIAAVVGGAALLIILAKKL